MLTAIKKMQLHKQTGKKTPDRNQLKIKKKHVAKVSWFHLAAKLQTTVLFSRFLSNNLG